MLSTQILSHFKKKEKNIEETTKQCLSNEKIPTFLIKPYWV